MIKDSYLENGTLEQNINKNLVNGKTLDDILKVVPTVTVLVPELPQETFSAEIWDSERQIPYVGIRIPSTNTVPVVGDNSQTGVLPYDVIPAYPIIVVKISERIISDTDIRYAHINQDIFFKSSNGLNYKFLDDAFNGIKFPTQRFTELRDLTPIEESYEIYKNIEGWQRDHIYYGINPTNLNGPINYDYSEHIGTIDATGDPEGLYHEIAEQTGDPMYGHELCDNCDNGFTAWTDGRFELRFRIVMNSKSGGGPFIDKQISVRPTDLFDLQYRHEVKKWLWWKSNHFYIVSITGKHFVSNIDVFNWDLRTKSVEVKITPSEEDATEYQMVSENFNSNYASNFNSSDKEGMQYGSSMQAQGSSNFTWMSKQGSDVFSDELVNFGDKVVVSKRTSFFMGSRYIKRYYGDNILRFTFEPRRVQ